MKCPNCPDTHLVTTDRDGVAVDCCPRCRGGWLDRDELDKNIDGAASDHTSIAPVTQGNASARAMSSSADYTSHGYSPAAGSRSSARPSTSDSASQRLPQ